MSSESFDSTRPTDGDRQKKPVPPGPTPVPQDPLMGIELGGCRIDALLGRGAMGAVYRAKQLRLDREVAVKVIRNDLLTDPRVLKRFEVEARTVGRFNSPHVVMVHDVGFERGVHFLVMELVRGKNLRDYVRLLAGGRMPVAEALPLLRQACRGLEEAQRLKVLHRDIKPDNLMLTERGVLKIADFGIAKPQEDFSLTLTSELIGTPLYMSPEQCHAAPDLDFRSDMYSLGATFYYLLTGEPPIKATSIYELIQTKTKLEHLSLWKSLPELDENHPLSRVIERMTALDRADRYDSYEALLADLELVQQGRTMEILRTKSKLAAGQGKPAGKRGNRGVALAALAVLGLSLGGGIWWMQWGGGAGPGQEQGGVGEFGTRLAALSARFAENGPSQALRDEVAAVPAGPELAAARNALLADLDHGIAIKGRLQQIDKPTSPGMPFVDLREHFARVDAAAAVSDAAGRELQQWREGAVAVARAEGELGALAVGALGSGFAAWQDERMRAGGDGKQIAALGERLAEIETARRTLLQLLPRLGDTIEQRLPAEKLTAARTGLTVEVAAPMAVDVSAALTEIRAEYAVQGPTASLLNRLEALRPTATEQVEQRSNLLDEFQNASKAQQAARGARLAYPQDPRLPFEDVANFFAAIDRELQPLIGPEGQWPAWAKKEREALRDEPVLQGKVVQRCRSALLEWQQGRGKPDPSAAELTSLQADLTALKDGIAKAKELFPSAAAELDALAPAEVVVQASKDLGTATRRLKWLADARETVRKLGITKALVDWRVQAPQWTSDLARHRTEAAEFGPDAEVQGELQRAEQIVRRWRDADTRVTNLGRALGSGDLLAAAAGSGTPLTGEGSDEWKALDGAAAGSLEAFTVIDSKLDISRALAGLDAARAGLTAVRTLAPEALARIERWTSAVQALQRAASGMVKVAGGRTKQTQDDVASFLLSRTEVTQGDFQRFLDELATLLAGLADPAAQAEACKARLGDLVPPAAVLTSMLERRTKLRSPAEPIDAICWHEAAAYARWFSLSLPTEAEWALAAFGDGNRYAYPWGAEWKEDDACRNIGSKLVDANSGGRSWRSSEGVTVHHLAGNAAEWLQTQPGATEAKLAGGRFNDNKKEQRQRAGGEDFHTATLGKTLPGFGCRTILRVREFLAPHFANGKFPNRGK